MLIIGLDAASQWKKFGYALGAFKGQRIHIELAGIVETLGEPNALANVIAPRLAKAEEALVAVDAPLGWPFLMGKHLAGHQAGEGLIPQKDDLFRRTTDRVV